MFVWIKSNRHDKQIKQNGISHIFLLILIHQGSWLSSIQEMVESFCTGGGRTFAHHEPWRTLLPNVCPFLSTHGQLRVDHGTNLKSSVRPLPSWLICMLSNREGLNPPVCLRARENKSLHLITNPNHISHNTLILLLLPEHELATSLGIEGDWSQGTERLCVCLFAGHELSR